MWWQSVKSDVSTALKAMVLTLDWNKHDQMATLARSIKGKMVISVNDIPEMRKAFSGLTIDTTEITYTVGGADRAARRS